MSTKTSAPVVGGLIEAAKAAESMLRTVHECASHDCEDCREHAGIHAKHLRDALAQQPAADQFIATFRCENNGIVGTTDAKVHSVTRHDDGRIEVVIDHWPKQPAGDAETEALAKYQPCGCVICTCEDEKQCQGCGAKHCGNRTNHPAYVKQKPAADCTCPHQDAREPDHDASCPVRLAQQPAETNITRREQELIAAAATHCDNCGCSWLDNGLNPVGCPYCKQRELLTLAEQWERDAAGCRRDGYIDAAVVKEDCAQRIRQTLGISAIAKALSQPPAAADDEEKRDVWRTLWLVLRQTGTVVVPPHDIVSTDWSKCQIEQTVHQLTGAVQLCATLLPTQQGGSDNDH